MPAIIGLLYSYCQTNDHSFSTIKKGTHYMNADLTKNSTERKSTIVFRDCLNYTAPCSMDKYCRQWGASLVKSVFPYSHFHSVEELMLTDSFPPYETFFSELKQVIIFDSHNFKTFPRKTFRMKTMKLLKMNTIVVKLCHQMTRKRCQI